MNSKSIRKVTSFIGVLFLLVAFSACAGGQTDKSDVADRSGLSQADFKDAPLEKKYEKIVLQRFEVDPKTDADYPGAVAECENSAMNALRSRNMFSSVEKDAAGMKYSDALLLKTKVTDLRIASTSARLWGGAWAGQSNMSVQIKFIDASTGAILREKVLSTSNNAIGANWSFGATDRSLPSDFGKMIAEYICSICPR